MISCWSKARKDFPNEGKDLYDMTDAMHMWEPLKKEDGLKKNKGRNDNP